jgi:hypothetical protein
MLPGGYNNNYPIVQTAMERMLGGVRAEEHAKQRKRK